jgi:hypothetical protein
MVGGVDFMGMPMQRGDRQPQLGVMVKIMLASPMQGDVRGNARRRCPDEQQEPYKEAAHRREFLQSPVRRSKPVPAP